MLPFPQKILFLLFAAVTGILGLRGFYRVYRRIRAGCDDPDTRFDNIPRRLTYALLTTLTQSRTFRMRPVVSFFHSFIFYGFTFYLLVNVVDLIDGFIPLSFYSLGLPGHLYVLAADLLSALVLLGVIALVIRRFFLPSRRDFTFNNHTPLHPAVRHGSIQMDSIIVSAFILFHVASRAIGAGAKIGMDGLDRFAPFATLLSHFFSPEHALAWHIFGFWGALGSVLLFLLYFPYSKHLHLFLAPAKYLVKRRETSGVLPRLELEVETDSPTLGARTLQDLGWPRLLDAYACIQCNRCQDVCPATATGKSLSPSALEINKRMELNANLRNNSGSAHGDPTPLLAFALTPEAAWACTTCGACVDVCPVGDEPMLDIIDIRRRQVMADAEFPAPLQTAFRGMERAKNPWGINHEKRLDWAEGLNVQTTDQNPEPDVLFWVGCAASYDPQSQKTARAFVQLLQHANVDFAVLGKRECCTGDSARRAGNEYLYRQLADTNIATLQQIKPKLIVATCPHCMNTIGKEYSQLGGDFRVLHHTEYLETLVADGRLPVAPAPGAVAYHDPCYLGRHNDVYEAPRNLLNILSNSVLELPRNRENSFCCGAGGAQFWKEEEPGAERISDNRYREAQQRLEAEEHKVLAVGCPFCKSMLDSTPGKEAGAIAVRDIAELLLEGVQRLSGVPATDQVTPSGPPSPVLASAAVSPPQLPARPSEPPTPPFLPETPHAPLAAPPAPPTRKKWTPAPAANRSTSANSTSNAPQQPSADEPPSPLPENAPLGDTSPKRKAWTPKPHANTDPPPVPETLTAPPPPSPEPSKRKRWTPKASPLQDATPEDPDSSS